MRKQVAPREGLTLPSLLTRVALALLAASTPGPLAAQALLPDTVVSPPTGPRIVMLAEPGSPLVALRLAVPLPPVRSGVDAGLMLRDLGLERMRTLATTVGARVAAARTPWGLAYTVEGAATDFDYLAAMLRAAVAEPAVGGPAFRAARDDLLERQARSAETASGKLEAALRGKLDPSGSDNAVGVPGASAVWDLWRSTHRASGMTLVVASPLPPAVVLAATRGFGVVDSTARAPVTSSAPAPRPPAPRVNVLRRGYGAAWQGGATGDPRAAVAAVLVADALRRAAEPEGYEAGVALLEFRDRWALMVTGASYADKASAVRRAVDQALSATRESLRPGSVAAAVARVRQDLLLRSRTPSGLVTTVGWAMEAAGDPTAAATRLEALSHMDAAAVDDFLAAMIARGPVNAQVQP